MIGLKLQPRWLDSHKTVSGIPGAVQITPPDTSGTPFSSKETGEHFLSLVRSSDAIVSGRRTFDVVKPLMMQMMQASQKRLLNIIMTRSPSAHASDTDPEELEFTDRSPDELIASLEPRGVKTLLIAGGGEIYAAFAAAGRVDEWFIAIEPLIIGGGTPFFSFIAEQRLELVEHRDLNSSTMLHHYRVESA